MYCHWCVLHFAYRLLQHSVVFAYRSLHSYVLRVARCRRSCFHVGTQQSTRARGPHCGACGSLPLVPSGTPSPCSMQPTAVGWVLTGYLSQVGLPVRPCSMQPGNGGLVAVTARTDRRFRVCAYSVPINSDSYYVAWGRMVYCATCLSACQCVPVAKY